MEEPSQAKRSLLPRSGKSLWFKDAYVGPEMVVVPAGSFRMGSSPSETSLDPYWNFHNIAEWPNRQISIAAPFAVGRYAVTVNEFDAFVTATRFKTQDGAHTFENGEWMFRKGRSWKAPGFDQSPVHPVVCVSWYEAKLYAAWLTKTTGDAYRLLTEAEWEYVCRAGTTTPFWWGSEISPKLANYEARYTYGNSPPDYAPY